MRRRSQTRVSWRLAFEWIQERRLPVLRSLSNESEGDAEMVKMMENVAPDAIDVAGDMDKYVADWIDGVAEDIRDRDGRRRGSGRDKMQKMVEVLRVQFLDRVMGVLVVWQGQVPRDGA